MNDAERPTTQPVAAPHELAERRARLDDETLERFAALAKDLADEQVMAAAWE